MGSSSAITLSTWVALHRAFRQQRSRPIVEAVGLLQLTAQQGRRAELEESLCLVAAPPERHAHQTVRLVEIVVEADGALVLAQGLVGLALVGEAPSRAAGAPSRLPA